ncbi:hypothetical protein PGQ11_008407 [Apiospora arundinis]|uniref:Uncharacterized protein n=1 Tax=Apiospora arundinis TaxID=335852 RepID=A0ABR2IF48_9PEZI
MKLPISVMTFAICASSFTEACTRIWMYYKTQTNLATGENTTTANYEAWDEGIRACSGNNATETDPFFSNKNSDGSCDDVLSVVDLWAEGSTSTAYYIYGGEAFL